MTGLLVCSFIVGFVVGAAVTHLANSSERKRIEQSRRVLRVDLVEYYRKKRALDERWKEL